MIANGTRFTVATSATVAPSISTAVPCRLRSRSWRAASVAVMAVRDAVGDDMVLMLDLMCRPAHHLEAQRFLDVLLGRGVEGGAGVGGHRILAGAEQAVDRLAGPACR